MQSRDWICRVMLIGILFGSPLALSTNLTAQSDEKTDKPATQEPEGDSKTEAKPQESEAKPQDPEDGSKDLDKAFDLKIEAKSTKDLEQVAKLCESAMQKGLSEKDTEQAKKLASASLLEFADQLANRVFQSGGRDRRWQLYRSQALPKLKQAIEYDDRLIDAYILTAKLEALPGGNRDNASAAVEKAVELAVDDRNQLSEALFIRASLATEAAARLADLNQAIKINPKNIQARQIRATYFISQGEPKKALEDYRAWLETEPENAEARILVANSLIGIGENFDEELQNEALKMLDEAITIKPELSVPYTIKARLYIAAEKPDQAIEAANKAIELEPKNIQALRLRATALAEQGEYEKALSDADTIINLQGFSPDGMQLRGAIRIQQQEFGKAIEDFRALSEANPDNRPLKRQLAALYNANDEPVEAIKIYTELLKFTNEEAWKDRPAPVQILLIAERGELLRGRGDARLSTGEHQLAVKDYEESLELGSQLRNVQEEAGVELSDPDDGVLNNLAWVLATSPFAEVRNGERAIELATQAAEVTEFKEAHILSTLASGYAESGQFDKAIEWVEKALEVNKRVAAESADKTATDKQFQSLNKELENYKKNEPWRELQSEDNEDKTEGKTEGKTEDKSEDKEDKADGKSEDKTDDQADG